MRTQRLARVWRGAAIALFVLAGISAASTTSAAADERAGGIRHSLAAQPLAAVLTRTTSLGSRPLRTAPAVWTAGDGLAQHTESQGSALATALDQQHPIIRSGHLRPTSIRALMRWVRARVDHRALTRSLADQHALRGALETFSEALSVAADVRVAPIPLETHHEGGISGFEIVATSSTATAAESGTSSTEHRLRIALNERGEMSLHLTEPGSAGRTEPIREITLPQRFDLKAQLQHLLLGESSSNPPGVDHIGDQALPYAAVTLSERHVQQALAAIVEHLPSPAEIERAARSATTGGPSSESGSTALRDFMLAMDEVGQHGHQLWAIPHLSGSGKERSIAGVTLRVRDGSVHHAPSLTVWLDRATNQVHLSTGPGHELVLPPVDRVNGRTLLAAGAN